MVQSAEFVALLAFDVAILLVVVLTSVAILKRLRDLE